MEHKSLSSWVVGDAGVDLASGPVMIQNVPEDISEGRW